MTDRTLHVMTLAGQACLLGVALVGAAVTAGLGLAVALHVENERRCRRRHLTAGGQL